MGLIHALNGIICAGCVAVGTMTFAGTSSGFTYQGQLKQGGSNVDGVADFQFRLWNAASLGSQIGATSSGTLNVDEGVFTADLDFGAGAFTGDARWLQIAVRYPAGRGDFVILTPRQRVAAAPYALFAMTPAGPQGEQGPAGPPGPPGIVTAGTVAGDILFIPGNNAQWAFAGPQAVVTLAPGQRVIAWGSAAMALGSGGPQNYLLDVGYQPAAGGTITNASGGGYLVGQLTTVRHIVSIQGIIDPGPGQWRIGVVVWNANANAISNNDFSKVVYMIVNQ